MTLQTQLLVSGKIEWTPIIGMTFFATLFLYAIHRIVGLEKVKQFTEKGRYKVIATFKSHIIVYAILGCLGAIYFFFISDFAVQLALVIPALISLAYVIPFLNKKRRLRDFGSIKIYLIALVWAWVTVVLPALELEKIQDPAVWMMIGERAFFIFAITLPFDIRDLKVDASNEVSTIPAKIGIPKTKRLALYVLLAMMLLVYWNVQIGFYPRITGFALLFSAISTYLLVHYSDKQDHDYYFTGLMDGTMLLQFGLVYLSIVLG